MTVTVLYTADCSDCARQAARTAKMDRLGRIEFWIDGEKQGSNGDACEI